MPYRRLPNTNQARLRALKAALQMSSSVAPADLRVSQKTALELGSFVPLYEQTLQQYTGSRERQAEVSKAVGETGKTARLYLSHYIQVFNMCIARGEIKPEARAMLQLEECGAAVPDLASDQSLIEWGRKVVEGEEQRLSTGGNRIYNPSPAVVKVKLQLFEENYNKHRDILATVKKFSDKLDEANQKADEIILKVWNEVEGSLAPVDSDEKRELCKEYGVVYFYRTQEIQKEFLLGQI